MERGTAAAPKNAGLWITWADSLGRLGRLAEALEVLRRGARPEASGDHAPIRIAQARILNTLGRGREAVEVLARDQDALTLSDRSMLWESIGRLRASKGDESGAREAYREWARILPDDPRPRLALIELAEDFGDAAVVRSTVETLRQIGGTEDIAWRLSRAQELLWTRTESDQPLSRRDPRLEEARRLIEGVLVDAPEIPAAHLLRGQALERLNRPDEAIASYRRAWDRGASAALARLVDLLTRYQKFDELAALKAKGQTARIDLLSAIGSYRVGDVEAASRFVEQIGQDGVALPGTQAWQAQMLEVIGKLDRSEAILQAVVDQKPGSLQPWLELIRSQARHGKAGEARATIERARKTVKGDSPLYFEACYAWASQGVPAAERAFHAAAAERPGDVDILVSAARFYEEAGRKREAIGQLRAARKVAPGDRGILRHEANLLSFAPATWAEAVALIGPDDAPADLAADRLARGIILARSPDPAGRARSLRVLEALLADLPADAPEVAPAREILARLYLDAGQPDRARQVMMISASSTADPDLLGLYVEALLRSRSLTEALRQIERLEILQPGTPAAAAFCVRWIRESSRPDEFARALVLVVREHPDRPDAEVFGRAAFEVILVADPKALDQAEAIAKLVAGSHPSASWMLGEVLFRRNRPGEALETCRASIESDSAEDRRGAAEVATDIATDPNVHEAYAARTDSILEVALRRDPKNYAILILVAMVRHIQARYEDEARIYREALAVRPGDALATNNLAWAISEGLNRPEEALALLDGLVTRRGRLGWVLDTRGVIRTRLARYDEAIRDLKEAGGDRPPPVTLYHLARACMKARRDQEFRHYRDLTRRSGVGPRDLDASERDELASILAL